MAIALLAACKGKGKGNDKEEPPLAVPKVDVATVLAKDSDKPPVLLLVDDKGARLAAAETWADLDAQKLKIAKASIPIEILDRQIREDVALGRQPSDSVATADEMGEGVAIDLASLEDVRDRRVGAAQDDPPPPEEEDKPDDGAEESGGTGTAMALEEGKMGKRDSDRAEGSTRCARTTRIPCSRGSKRSSKHAPPA